jgi:hypothetical protein
VSSKIGFIAGAGIGYVLGARDGRGRYEQLKSKASELWNDEDVRNKVRSAGGSVQDVAKDAARRMPPHQPDAEKDAATA